MIEVAKAAGFCFGVKRAVEHAYKKLEEGKIYTYGSIINNKIVTEDLERKGVKIISSMDEVQDGTVIIRSHGVPKNIYEELEARKIAYEDCTCPYVKKIHYIVEESQKAGKSIIIAGNRDHPEIIGVNGWCQNQGIIIEAVEEISTDMDKYKKYILVAQTTFRSSVFEDIANALKNMGLDIEIRNTICSATIERQNETENLAKKMSHMIVVGDKSSSNTKKLYEISKKYCGNAYLIESIRDLQLNIFSANDKIGITAGASTPPAIIKEVENTMNEEFNGNQTFEELLNESLVTLHTGEVVKGTVIAVSNGEISVNLNYKSDGIITRSEYSDDPDADPAKDYKAGDEMDVFVVRVNDGEGNVLLSKKRLDSQKGYLEVKEAFESGKIVKGKVSEIVKGGLMANIKGMKVFVPASQISSRYVEDLASMKGEELDFNIIEFDQSKRRIVAGRRDLVLKQEQVEKQKVFDKLEVGMRVEGTVRRIVNFGAFVDLGGIDGLIHISELSWIRVRRVSDIVKEGDKVEVIIREIDTEKGKIALSLREVKGNPWDTATETYAVGSILEGKVVRMVPFGAFVELEEGIDGLLHISQISSKRIAKPEDVLEIGQTVKVKVTELDLDSKKISLSKKEVDGIEAPEEVVSEASTDETAE